MECQLKSSVNEGNLCPLLIDRQISYMILFYFLYPGAQQNLGKQMRECVLEAFIKFTWV
jgi:hypothetical protein